MKEKMTFEMTRRGFLGTALGGAAALAAGPAAAQAKTLNILSHRVHQAVLMPEGGEDLLAGWKSAQDADAVFTTFDSNPLMDRLFREASLGSTDYGVGYMVDNRPTSEIASLFEPLDGFQKDDPIEDFGDIAPGLVQGMTVDGNLVGIPVRHATQGLFYNEALLEEAGISAPPTTLEELVEQAGKLTFTSSAGTPVTGMILASDLAVFPVMFARAFGGDFITKDFQLVPDPEAMEKGLDTGPVLLSETVDIRPDDTAASLTERLSVIGAGLLPRALAALDRGGLVETAQSTDGVTYAHKISSDEARIDWSRPAAEIDCKIRGLSPFPGAWFEAPSAKDPQRVKALLSRLAPNVKGAPGEVMQADDRLVIATGDGGVELLRLQRAGKSAQSPAEFLRGFPLPVGTRL